MRLDRNTASRLGGVAALAVLLASCADQPLQPGPELPSLSRVAAVSEQAANDQHLVLFRGNGVPAGFTSRVEALGGTVQYSHDVGFAVIEGVSDDAAATLGRGRSVVEIQPDFSFQLEPMVLDEPVSAFDNGLDSPEAPGTAFFYARQWNMRAIRADEAWDAGRLGSSSVTLAILDTGIDYEYLDLIGRVDLERSISFVQDDDFLVGLLFPDKHLSTDLHLHGTHVASTAVSNAEVIAGVTSHTTLMSVKVCDVLGNCAFGDVIPGILHAVDNGADVINISLGGAFSKAGTRGLVGFINRVFNYANRAGVTVVVSAGNDAADLDHNGNEFATYCDAPNVLCVAATGPTASAGYYGPWTDVDAQAPYSNFGRSAISVAAPGGTGAGWIWSACSGTSLVIPVCQTGWYIVGMTGTSQAAPHVAGLAALLVEDYGRNPGRIRARIQQSAEDLGKRGTDPVYGKGRIDVAAAVNQ